MACQGNTDQQYKHDTEFTDSMCSVCLLPIYDQFVCVVNENHFHSLCLNCSECHIKLFDKCYMKDGNVYCKEDFLKKFRMKCASCNYSIPSSENVRRLNDFFYHLKCFSCLICRHQLNTGDEFYLINNQKLICQIDYQLLKNKKFDHTNNRSRTTIRQNQLEILQQAYNTNSKLTRNIQQLLVIKTGLDMQAVKNWFQNHRAKEKRFKKYLNKHETIGIKTQEEEETSNECDTIISYDENDLDDSSQELYPPFDELFFLLSQ